MGYSKEAQKAIADQRAYIESELRKSSVLTKVEAAINSLDYASEALEKLSKHMASIDYGNQDACEHCNRRGISPEAGGKTLAYIAKVVNEQARLLEFAKGKPDSRTDVVGLAELFKVLTGDQFMQVSEWIDEGMKRVQQPANSAPA
jgi:hypothetical protein